LTLLKDREMSMREKKVVLIKQYTEAFKLKVVDEYENCGQTSHALAQHYGISKGAVMNWVRKYGHYDRQTKIVRVSMKSESEQINELKAALADAHIKNRYLESLVEVCGEYVGHDLKKNYGTEVLKKQQEATKQKGSQ
jgi:transposase-like protein